MLTPNRTNLAYDFSLFDTEETEQRVNHKNQKRNERQPMTLLKNSVAKRGNMFRIIIIAVSIAAIPIFYLNSRIELSELSYKIGQDTELYEQALSDNERYKVELDNMVTLTKVEEYAVNELHLEKIKSSQEKHVEFNTENMTEVIPEENGNPIAAAENWLRDVLEYLGF